MSTITTSQENPTAGTEKSRVQAYVELTKLRISVMVLFSFAAAFFLAAGTAATAPDQTITFTLFFGAMVGMLAIAASGNAMNMYLERYSDFLMPRTAKRPLPAQRLSATEVATFGAVTFGIGVGFLLALVNWETALCGVANWILYVFIYTPLKRKTHLNTEIGVGAGAIPIVMGSLAATHSIGLVCWAFFGVLFLWQFPHFMAIAWMYRKDYQSGGLKMLTVTEPTGAAAGRKAIITGVMLIAVSLVPAFAMRTTTHVWIFSILAVLLGLFYLKSAIAFNRSRTDPIARKLLRVSIMYLPLYMIVLLVACFT